MSKNPKIEKICIYCEHASIKERDGDISVICRGKRGVAPDGHCLRFRYDPLKYTPKAKLPLPTLDPEAVID